MSLPKNLAEATVDNMFDVAEQVLRSIPTAVDAAVKDIEDQFGVTVSSEVANGLMACGMVLMMSKAKAIQQHIEAANE
jgi:hypothetical protein